MLLTVEKGIRSGICHAVHRYAKVNNKYQENYNKNKESLYLQYLDANNLKGCTMSQKFSLNNFKWEKKTKYNEKFIKSFDEDSNRGYILEVDLEYPKSLHDFHSDLAFLPERMRIHKCNKLVCNLFDKNKCIVHIIALKDALNHGLVLKKVHRVIKFN